MDCVEYLDNCLSAYADGELTAGERRAADHHLATCARCRAELASERALKQAIRESLGPRKTPIAVEARIRAALDAIPANFDTKPRRHRSAAGLIRGKFWIPVALAACLAAGIFTWRGFVPPAEIPLLHQASAELTAFAAGFTPNVSSASEAAVHNAYAMAGMPSGMWNFAAAGYQLVGGRLGTMPGGEHVTYTLYRSASGSPILCMRFKGVKLTAPGGAVMRLGAHAFYRRGDTSFCLTIDPNGHFTCILASRQPIKRFIHTVELARVDQKF
ncbi:MAG: anti-sigma factor family protein [Candidatus Binataceae bacterium]